MTTLNTPNPRELREYGQIGQESGLSNTPDVKPLSNLSSADLRKMVTAAELKEQEALLAKKKSQPGQLAEADNGQLEIADPNILVQAGAMAKKSMTADTLQANRAEALEAFLNGKIDIEKPADVRRITEDYSGPIQ